MTPCPTEAFAALRAALDEMLAADAQIDLTPEGDEALDRFDHAAGDVMAAWGRLCAHPAILGEIADQLAARHGGRVQ